MSNRRSNISHLLPLALCFALLSACRPVEPRVEPNSGMPTAGSPSQGAGETEQTSSSAHSPSHTPVPTSTQPPQPVDLVVLHTNDTWGYYDPCG
jgi:hypothetical protein